LAITGHLLKRIGLAATIAAAAADAALTVRGTVVVPTEDADVAGWAVLKPAQVEPIYWIASSLGALQVNALIGSEAL
jgi:hypothetical protein